MQFSILRAIIETSLNQFRCQQCQSKLDENNLIIRSISDNGADFMLTCPHCQSQTIMHAEMGLPQSTNLQQSSPKIINHKALKEQDILLIEQTLKDSNTLEDLLL